MPADGLWVNALEGMKIEIAYNKIQKSTLLMQK
jgi:hypothetical protein